MFCVLERKHGICPAWPRLSWRHISAKLQDARGTIAKEIQYYDAFNNLVRRRLDADGAGTGGFTEKLWIYDGDEAILEFASSTATAPSHRYLWGPAGRDASRARLFHAPTATRSTKSWPTSRWPPAARAMSAGRVADWQGTVRDVATYNAATNVTTIANHKVYEAFGKVFSETSATVDTIFGYTGRFFDDRRAGVDE